MIIEYSSEYESVVKDLLVELQEYIESIDKECYNIIGTNFREKYFNKTIEEINKYEGKMYLYKEDKILGLIVGIINNDEIETYDFKAPKRGRITELVVSKEARGKNIGTKLLTAMEKYLKDNACEDILLGVFAYNESAYRFYQKHGYHNRLIDMTKSIK